MNEQQVDEIIEVLLEVASDWKLIIFDTQADHMPNGDEDKAKDFTMIKKALQKDRPCHRRSSRCRPPHRLGRVKRAWQLPAAAGTGCGDADQRQANHQREAKVWAKVPAHHVRR
jgi:hypothetical protein